MVPNQYFRTCLQRILNAIQGGFSMSIRIKLPTHCYYKDPFTNGLFCFSPHTKTLTHTHHNSFIDITDTAAVTIAATSYLHIATTLSYKYLYIYLSQLMPVQTHSIHCILMYYYYKHTLSH